MIRFIKIHGLDLDGATSLPQISRTPEGIAMGAVPGWKLLFDPDFTDAAGGEYRNRALPDDLPQTSGVAGDDEFPNGAPAIRYESPWSFGYTLERVGFNRDAWSVFAVIRPGTGSISSFFRSNASTTAPNVGVRLGLHSNGNIFRVWEYGGTGDGQPVRLEYDGGFAERAGPSLLMATFSTREGLRIYDNGEEVATDADDRRPLQSGYGPGELRSHFNARGLYGMMGLLDIDLGWREHSGYRRAIERFLMDKYGID